MKQKTTFILLFYILFNTIYSFGQDVNIKTIDSIIGNSVTKIKPVSYSVAILKDDKIVFNKGYGLKDVTNKNEPVTEGSVYCVGSCSKAFTSACMAKLVSDGKLKWDDKVIKYLPNFKLSDDYITKELTITDILCHRSGLGEFDGDLEWYCSNYTPEELIFKLRFYPIKNNFRADFGYSNSMYIVAGEIIKNVTGLSWEEYMTKEIFIPLEMNNTYPQISDLSVVKNIALPHVNSVKPDTFMMNTHPAGSIFSTTTDLSKWLIMLMNNGKFKNRQIIKEWDAKNLFHQHFPLRVWDSYKDFDTKFRAYGLGWYIMDYHSKKLVYHEGGYPGYVTKILMIPEDKLGIIILSNDFNETNLFRSLSYALLDNIYKINGRDWIGEEYAEKMEYEKQISKGLEPRIKKIANSKPSLKLIDYAGLYEDKIYGKAEITFDGKKLKLTFLPAKEKFNAFLEHWHYDTFRFKFNEEIVPEGYLTFNFDSSGKITGFKIDNQSTDFHFAYLDFKIIK
jgi:CubicO group peptidase (beta-lactamase class C family)